MRGVLNGLIAGLLVFGNCQAAIAHSGGGGVRYTTVVVPGYSGPVAPPQNSGSRSPYLQCDGHPAIMSDTEKFARFMGAITLLGLFAPRPEVPEPAARLFADKGVEACSKLIDGAEQPQKISQEKNPLRRIPLLLARAAHQIEAKNYPADVHKARDEANAIHLIGDPYFDRSMGLSFDKIESLALIREGDGAAAREVSLRGVIHMPYSFVAVCSGYDYFWANPTGNSTEDAFDSVQDRLVSYASTIHANRLEQLGRFAEAATLREAILVRLTNLATSQQPNWASAASAISLAMAGQWDLANTRADEARKGVDDADAAGKPDTNKGQVLDALDFFQLLQLAHQGKIDEARRNFAARTAWTSVSQGVVWQEADILRKGAKPDQLFGALAKSGTEQFEARRQQVAATALQADTDNKTLFNYITPYAKIDQYERLSRFVWDTTHSGIIAEKPSENSKFWLLSSGPLEPIWAITRPDLYMLHSALQAKARGFKGFVFIMSPANLTNAWVMFGNPGDAAMPAQLYLDADAVIAELRQVIPSPDELKARQAKRGV